MPGLFARASLFPSRLPSCPAALGILFRQTGVGRYAVGAPQSEVGRLDSPISAPGVGQPFTDAFLWLIARRQIGDASALHLPAGLPERGQNLFDRARATFIWGSAPAPAPLGLSTLLMRRPAVFSDELSKVPASGGRLMAAFEPAAPPGPHTPGLYTVASRLAPPPPTAASCHTQPRSLPSCLSATLPIIPGRSHLSCQLFPSFHVWFYWIARWRRKGVALFLLFIRRLDIIGCVNERKRFWGFV